MKKINLFHSYNFLKEKNIKLVENKIYNNENELMLIILNIPVKNRNLYSIEIKKKLINKIFSFKNNKICDNSFYTKNNLKIYLNVNYQLLYTLVENKKDIPEKNLLFKNLKMNFYKKVDFNKKLSNILTINKNYNQKITLKNILVNDPSMNIIKIYNLYFDLDNDLIFKKYNYKKILNDIKIIFYDIKYKLIYDLLNLIENKKTLIISDKKEDWDLYNKFKNIIILSEKQYLNERNLLEYYDIIIIDNLLIRIYEKYNNIIYINNSLDELNIKTLIKIYSFFYYINEDHISEKTIINMSKLLYFKNYKMNLFVNKMININDKNIINNKNYTNVNYTLKLEKNYKNSNNDYCSICYDIFDKNNYCITDCNHSYCKSCLDNLMLYTKNCAYCRQKINNIYKIEYNKTDILNMKKKNNIGNKLLNFINIIKKNKKNNILIYDNYNINFINNILNFLKLKNNLIMLKKKNVNSENLFIDSNKINYIFLENKLLFEKTINLIMTEQIHIKKNLFFIN